MVVVYNIVLIFLAIILLPVIAVAFYVQPKFRAGFKEKLGFYEFDNKGRKTTVFHAVSFSKAISCKTS